MDALLHSIRQAGPDLGDVWEIVALIEASGYSDERIDQTFGYPDARRLGEVVFEQLRRERTARPPAPIERAPVWRRAGSQAAAFVVNFSGSFVYAVPWVVMFYLDHVHPEALAVPASLATPLLLAVVASLICTGGFVQAIARKGVIYWALDQRALALHVGRRLFDAGAALTLGLALLGAVVAWYFRVLPVPAIIMGVVSYVTLSFLWMICALMTISGHRWRVPALFATALAGFIVLRSMGFGVLTADLGATYIALLTGGLLVLADRVLAGETLPPLMPNARVVQHTLAPYFWYGTMYFSLLFADRMVASLGRVVEGNGFGLEPEYKQATDVALLTFLVAAAIVEHLNERFMHSLRGDVTRVPSRDIARLRWRLRRRYIVMVVGIAAIFPAIDVLCRWISQALGSLEFSSSGWRVLVLASTGYLFLCVGLFNSLILVSLNRPMAVVGSFIIALGVDVVCGGVVTAWAGSQYAVLGLVVGAAALAVRTTVQVTGILDSPGHAYCAS
jgi:hypothetical protein